ncbi:hypothetical protein GQ44DRAFT_721775 [Phaeosphaeriaceae sp. PMI808]|nr:hypothetical protein GQ44DRAFT_721775 [Phaeosphaeriaceae sp. PMI808]
MCAQSPIIRRGGLCVRKFTPKKQSRPNHSDLTLSHILLARHEVNLERKALHDVRMPNGQVLLRGTNLSIHTFQFHNSEVYEHSDQFDSYRFVKLRRKRGKWTSSASAVSTSAYHFVFGINRSICPGRFFTIGEAKTALAVILLGYDVRLKHGYIPKTVQYGFEILTDSAACAEVKWRSN